MQYSHILCVSIPQFSRCLQHLLMGTFTVYVLGLERPLITVYNGPYTCLMITWPEMICILFMVPIESLIRDLENHEELMHKVHVYQELLSEWLNLIVSHWSPLNAVAIHYMTDSAEPSECEHSLNFSLYYRKALFVENRNPSFSFIKFFIGDATTIILRPLNFLKGTGFVVFFFFLLVFQNFTTLYCFVWLSVPLLLGPLLLMLPAAICAFITGCYCYAALRVSLNRADHMHCDD